MPAASSSRRTAAQAISVQLVFQRTVIGPQQVEVGRAAFRIADGVEIHPHLTQAKVAQPRDGDLDDLGVEGGTSAPDRLHVQLEELAVSTFLGAVVAEHRPDQIQPSRLWLLVEVAFEIRPDDAGGRFRSEGELASAAVLEAVQLLGDSVGVLADAVAKELYRF